MRRAEKTQASVLGRNVRRAACMALVSGLITVLLLYVVSAAAAQGKLPLERKEQIVLLCVFLGALPTSIAACIKEGRGVLKTAAVACVVYALLLILVGLFMKSNLNSSVQYLKSVICAGAGMLLGCALYAIRKPKMRRRRRRYNK